MLVYMLVNEVDELVYVGQTTTTMKDRLGLHAQSVKEGSQSPLHLAMRDLPDEHAWSFVVLQNCYTQEELDACEEWWITYCSSADPSVGYNAHRSAHGGKRDQSSKKNHMLTAPVRPTSPLAGLDAEARREFFREAGRRGAKKSRGH